MEFGISLVGITGRRFLPTFVSFEVNRPFSFVIRANNFVVLQGHVYDPTS